MRLTAGDLAVVILASGIAVALPTTLIIIALNPASTIDPELIGVISTIAAAAVGAVGAWLGFRRNGTATTAAPRAVEQVPVRPRQNPPV